MKKWKSQSSFVTKSVGFGRTELLFFFPCSKSRDLGPGHCFRACSFKNKGKKVDFHETFGLWGVKKPKKKRKSGTKSVKCWSPELWMRPKRSGRSAQIFSRILDVKILERNCKHQDCFWIFLRLSCGFSPQSRKSTYKRLGAKLRFVRADQAHFYYLV